LDISALSPPIVMGRHSVGGSVPRIQRRSIATEPSVRIARSSAIG
jgi:hypothetical protein